ncbi:hypothetical protein PWT90_09961 [Aphanocladium album]|nr:hypothetical protein PWT90_09961 [Aphanocladium album]
MSGFEIAGIVLGTIPLVISALEHYHDGVSAIQRWRRYQRERQHLARILKTEQIKLQNICEELLKGLVPDSQIERMIKDPFGLQWHDSQIRSKCAGLHARTDAPLGHRSRNDDAEEIAFLRRELQRAVFTLSRSTYSDLTTSIRNSISDLETLTNQNVRLEPQRQQLSQVRLLTLLREISSGLYRALESSLSCACAHTLSLKLAARPSEIMYADDELEMLNKLDLLLLLSSKQHSVVTEIEDSWRGFRFCSAPMMHAEKSSQWLFQVPSQPTRKRVSFQQMPSFTGQRSSVATVTQIATSHAVCLSVPIQSADTIGSPKRIANLCAETASSHSTQPNECYGLISDTRTSPTRQYMVHPASFISQFTAGCSTISLQEVLEGNATMLPMTLSEQLQLAVTISSSFLQLYDTPWLSRSFSSADIMFFQRDGVYLYDNVYIWKEVKEDRPQSLGPASLITANRNLALLSLGFLLLEIFYARPIGQPDGSQRAPLERKFAEAQKMLRMLRLESSNYFSALTYFGMHLADSLVMLVPALLLCGAAAQLLPTDTKVADVKQAGFQKPFEAAPERPSARTQVEAPTLCPSQGESQWTGFIPVSGERDLFYWYFDSRSDPEHDPIIINFSGGPGGSGMLGALGPNGPCTLKGDEVRPNPWSSNNNASILYLDSPAGAGFSRVADGTPLPSTDLEAAVDFQRFLNVFFTDAFPEKRHLPLHMQTKSYGGHFGPVSLHHILESRRNDSDLAFWGDIRSLTLYDPHIDWTPTFIGLYPLLCDNKETAGLLNAMACEFLAEHMPEQKRLGRACRAAYDGGSECRAAHDYGLDVMMAPYKDLRLDLTDFHEKCTQEYKDLLCRDVGLKTTDDFMNQDWVKVDLGVPIECRFSILNRDIWHAFHDSGSWHVPTTEELADVLDVYREENIGDIKVLYMNGNTDVLWNTPGAIRLLHHLRWSGQSEFRNKRFQSFPEGLSHTGTWKATADGRLAFFAIDGVGHFPSGTLSKCLYEIMERWMREGWRM